MRSNYFITFNSLLVSILFTSTAFSQSDAVAMSDLRNPVRQVLLKAKVPGSTVKSTTSRVSTKVARSFLKNFHDAKNIYWTANGREYIAEFASDGRQVLAWFTKSGMLQCVNYYGYARHLPNSYKQIIESNYKEYSITATAEIKCRGGEAWIITLQNCSLMRKIRIIDDHIEEIEFLKKNL